MEWKEQRALDERPLQPFEPVAFFRFDQSPSVTIELDEKRSCRFIMLKPTGLRLQKRPYKPHHVD